MLNGVVVLRLVGVVSGFMGVLLVDTVFANFGPAGVGGVEETLETLVFRPKLFLISFHCSSQARAVNVSGPGQSLAMLLKSILTLEFCSTILSRSCSRCLLVTVSCRRAGCELILGNIKKMYINGRQYQYSPITFTLRRRVVGH